MSKVYSDKASAMTDIADLKRALAATPEISDGRWVLIDAQDFDRIKDEAGRVIDHLECAMEEMEEDEIPDPERPE